MKSVSETKAIRIYPMPDKTYGIMWKIHLPKSCQKKFETQMANGANGVRP